MSRIHKSMAFLALFFLSFSLSSATSLAKDTVIYIVRHAEKDIKDPKNSDPELNSEGRNRAKALNHFLRKTKITAVFSTNFQRTMQTVEPVALRNGITSKPYDSKQPDELVRLIRSDFEGKNILIAGHSNTILELVKAFGTSPPVNKLNDDDYDLVFIISLHTNGKSDLKIKRYGKHHHSTEIAFSKLAP
jgi:2,3-bisphosphoglycerate-dependent phosphoglycerate mutase